MGRGKEVEMLDANVCSCDHEHLGEAIRSDRLDRSRQCNFTPNVPCQPKEECRHPWHLKSMGWST